MPAVVGKKYGNSWETNWFFIEFTVPDEWDQLAANEDEFHLLWNSNSEASLYDYDTGKYLQAFSVPTRNFYILDRNGDRHFKFAIEMANNGNTEVNPDLVDDQFPSGSWFVFSSCQIGLLRKNMYDLRSDFNLLYDIANSMTEDNYQYGELSYGILHQMWDILVTTDDISDEQVTEARKIAQQYLSQHNHNLVHQIHAVGHCHIDVAWLWPFRETRRKWARSWSSQLKLMELYPDFKFCASSAQQYQFVKDDYPELFTRIQDKAKQGRFEFVGGSWLEFDGNMPSGESMARQFLYGQRFFKDNFGSYCNVFFMPDTFGYSAQLPQIMSEAGIKRFMTQKLSWNRYNTFPYNTFNWWGLDGTQVLTHFPPADTYSSDGKLDSVLKSQSNFKDKAISNYSLLLYGQGDGGGGPERSHIESLTRLQDLMGVPNVKFSTINDFFTDIENEHADIYTWQGELFLEIHNGTYTTMAENKRNNRKMEFLLRDAEFVSTIALTHSKEFEDPKQKLEEVWKLVLLDQFHDVIPGTSIEMVYDDTRKHYKYTFDTINTLLDDFSSHLFRLFVNPKLEVTLKRYDISVPPVECNSAQDTKFIVFNSEGFDRTEYISVSVNDKHYSGYISVPQNGYTIFTVDDIVCESSDDIKIKYEETKTTFEVKTQFYELEISKNGRITSYLDKSFFKHKPKQMIDLKNGQLNMIHIHDDVPDYWDAWDVFDWARYTQHDVLADPEHTEVVWDTPECLCIKFNYNVSYKSKIQQIMVFYSNTQRIDFKTTAHWYEYKKLLDVSFPVKIHTDYFTFDVQNGVLRRTSTNNTLWDQAKYEVWGHKFVDLSDGSLGFSIMNDCKYGHHCKDNVLGLTLLRSSKWPNKNADMETHTFTYSLYFHHGDIGMKQMQTEAFAINSPLRCYSVPVKVSQKNSNSFSFITINQSNVILDALKVSEDNKNEYVMRIHESLGATTVAEITLNFCNLDTVVETNILEEERSGDFYDDVGESLVSFSKNKMIVELRAFKIFTLKFTVKDE